jgi:predicted DNA-binding transcriptional regulator YafY
MQRVIERVLNLLAFLLTVERPVTADEIRHTVAGYDQETDEAFRRTFERDKDLLKSLGVPLRLDFTDAWEVEQGYVVSPDEYALADPGLTDDERAALWLASRMVSLGGTTAAPSAILKLGGAPAAASGDPLTADLGADPTVLADLFTAVVERRRATFDYRGSERRADPYGLVHRMGHWYLVAAVNGEIKTFRVDRADSVRLGKKTGAFDRPKGFSAAAGFPEAPWEAGEDDVEAIVVFDADVAWWAERQLGGGRALLHAQPDGSLRAALAVASPEAFIGWLIGFEDSAEILEPANLREAMVARMGIK